LDTKALRVKKLTKIVSARWDGPGAQKESRRRPRTQTKKKKKKKKKKKQDALGRAGKIEGSETAEPLAKGGGGKRRGSRRGLLSRHTPDLKKPKPEKKWSIHS